MGDAFVFMQSIGQCSGPCVSNIVVFFGVGEKHKVEKRKILTPKVQSGDAFVFTQSMGQCSGPCVSNLVGFFGVGEKHKVEKRKNTYTKGEGW